MVDNARCTISARIYLSFRGKPEHRVSITETMAANLASNWLDSMCAHGISDSKARQIIAATDLGEAIADCRASSDDPSHVGRIPDDKLVVRQSDTEPFADYQMQLENLRVLNRDIPPARV